MNPSWHFLQQSRGDLEQTILRHVRLYTGQLLQCALKGRTPLAALKEWCREKRELSKKLLYNHAVSET